MGLQVWLITSKQTDPDLKTDHQLDFEHFLKRTKFGGKKKLTRNWRNSAFCHPHLINIWMVNFINKANGWWFIGISIWKFNPYFPNTTKIRTCHNHNEHYPNSKHNHTSIESFTSRKKLTPICKYICIEAVNLVLSLILKAQTKWTEKFTLTREGISKKAMR